MKVRMKSFIFLAPLVGAFFVVGIAFAGGAPGTIATDSDSAAVWGGQQPCGKLYTVDCGTMGTGGCTGQSGYDTSCTNWVGTGYKTGGVTCGCSCGSIATGWAIGCATTTTATTVTIP